MTYSHFGRRATAILALVIGFMTTNQAAAQRPDTTELLPDDTVVFVRIPSIPELLERLEETSTGQIFNDDRIRPLFEELYGSAAIEFEQIEDQVGLSLDEIMELPQGELSVALVVEDGELAVVIFFEVGDSLESAQILLDRGEELAQSDGGSAESETIGDIDLRTIEGGDGESVTYFIRDECICVSNNNYVAQDILARWDGLSAEDERTFDTNRKFATIMNRCRNVDDERAQFQFFVDPIEIARVQASQSVAGRAGFAFVPTIGLDGLLAIGGTMTMATERYDSVSHLHVLMSNPRKGVMEALAMEPGNTEPEDWIPADAIAYTTLNWDFQQTYDAIETLVDGFRGEGSVRRNLEEDFGENVGVDFYEDILDNMEGRVSIVQWVEPPARMNSQTFMIGFKLNDGDNFQDTIDDFLATVDGDGRIVEEEYEGEIYFKVPTGGQNRNRRFNPDTGEVEEFEPPEPPFEVRTPSPSFGIVDGYFIATDSEEALKAAIRAADDPEESLSSDPEFEIVNDEVKRLVGTNYPGAVMYSRPAESFRFLFDLAGGDDMRNMLSAGAEENEFVARIRDAMDDNPLPDFEEFEALMPPSGGVMTNDETGFHITFFSLRPER